jgi:copper(I)-binding protein
MNLKTMTFTSLKRALTMAALLGLSLHVSAQTLVEDAWVRATVPQQASSGAFMRITASADSKLLSVSSPVAKNVQIHESTLKDDIMRMQAVASVPLPAGTAVTFDPNGYHVMLMDLTGQIKEGDQVPLTLTVEDAKGVRESIEVLAPARALNAPEQDHKHLH